MLSVVSNPSPRNKVLFSRTQTKHFALYFFNVIFFQFLQIYTKLSAHVRINIVKLNEPFFYLANECSIKFLEGVLPNITHMFLAARRSGKYAYVLNYEVHYLNYLLAAFKDE